MDIRSNVLAILVAGSPAPGINSVISAITIEALNNGLDVIGIKWGFKCIMQGQTQGCIVPLGYQHVSSIHSQAGSILFTSKRQLSNGQEVDNVLRSLEYLRVRYLVTIGGVETAYSSHLINQAATAAALDLSIVHTPKTVYNDLPMPPECITFGFTTARDTGVALCQNYKVDARTLGRWYIITVIGQRAGHLAEGIGKGAAATLTLIPEEFTKGSVDLKNILDIIESTMIKRLAVGRDYGVIILTEGIVDKLPDTEITTLFGSVADGYGMFSKVIRDHIYQRLMRKRIKMTVCSSSIGSEVRSAPPNSTDINLARDLGYGAAQFLLKGGSGQMVCLKGSSIITNDLDLNKLSEVGEHPIRLVDTKSGSYEVAFKYQIRLKRSDFQDAELLKNMADICRTDENSFAAQFKYVAV